MKEIILSAPGKNAINSALMRQIIDELAAAAGEPLLLTGAGDAFSAGLNLKEVLSLDRAGMATFLELLEEMTRALFEYPGPTVALVNGHAIAGGCVLALCCDHRVAPASGKARIGLNEVALGLRFPPRVMKLVKARVPARALGRVVLGAELFDPATALELGLLDELSDDASARAGERLAAFAAHPPDAYARAKHLVRGGVLDVSAAEAASFDRDDLGAWVSDALREKIRQVLAR
ncbi:MAG: enoyl-CoA hydratase/isomerase family protein [Polyangiaceae bacterium]|nr:enoyl-CoA hydratase/isomerase family protein [Polyangiaceae bacterium]